MKHIIFGIVSSLMVVLTIVAVLTVEGRNSRERELKSALRSSVKSVVSEAAVSRIESAADESDMKKRFEDIMNKRLKSAERSKKDRQFKLKYTYYGADPEKGILSCKVDESFTNPNGSIAHISCTETAVLEQEKTEKLMKIKFISEKSDGSEYLYKEYELLKGMDMKVPAEPVCPGKTFRGWSESGENVSDLPEKVVKNAEYRAVFS